MNDSISKGEIIHAVNAEVNKPKKVRYKLHTPIEEVVIEFDEKEEVTSIDHILSDSIPIFEESAQAYKAWTSEDMGKTEPSDLISRADAIDAVAEEWLSEASAESPYVNDDDIDRYRELAEELFADIPSADAVSREDYEDIIKDYRKQYENMNNEIADLEAKLSADAVQGEWEHWGSLFSDESEVIDTIVCSVCGARFIEPKDEPKGEYNYCPNCGARMKGGAE